MAIKQVIISENFGDRYRAEIGEDDKFYIITFFKDGSQVRSKCMPKTTDYDTIIGECKNWLNNIQVI